MPFQIALSGLNAASTSLNTTANNIANVNTTGFKSSRANFVELFATGLQNVQENATGLGARTSSIQQLFSQGSLEFTDNNLDLAMIGSGFFTLADDQGAFSYTRAGNFGVDRDGNIVNDQGLKLQGFPPLDIDGADDTFNTGQLVDLTLNTTNAPPSATGTINIGLNLPSDAETPDDLWVGPDETDPTDIQPPLPSTYNHTTSVTLFDSLGGAKTGTFYFRKTANDNEWEAYLTVDGSAVNAAPVVLQFDEFGSLSEIDGDATATSFDFTAFASPPAADLELTANFAELTQYGSAFNVNSLTQDGFASGRLASIQITDEGIVSARFTNGQSEALGQLVITNFANPQGLENVSDTRWAETADSGQALRGAAGTGNFGEIQSGAIENANVDLARELVNMITAQRTYQANAQMITTADQITQTVLNLR
jgi:flagellar hook protein FlgE